MKLKDFLTLKVGAGVLISGTRYNPLINYDWSTTTTSGLRYLKDVGSTPTYNASMYFGRGAYLNGVDQTITVPINTTIQTALKRVNGVVTINETSQTLTNYVISGLGVHKDYYLFTRLLTTAEKDSYTNTPELFYAMAQADSTCVLNMPMCETDSYARDMENYSKGSELDTSFVPYNYTPSVTTARIAQFNLGLVVEANKTYLVEIEYDDTANSILKGYYCYGEKGDGTYTTFHTALKDIVKGTKGTAFYLVQIPSTYLRLSSTTAYAWITTTAAADKTAYISVRSLKEVTGTDHPIINYTSSVRGKAKNLQYGLQTCKFVRDDLGVIQSASNYLECDGVGYGNTGNYIDSLTEFSMEFIGLFKTSSAEQSHGVGYSNAYNRITFSINSSGRLFSRCGGTIFNYSTESLFNVSTYLTLTFVQSTKIFKLYLNGNYVGQVSNVNFISTVGDYTIGSQGFTTYAVNGDIRLFQVHNKVLTQAEITENYNSYVAKGLLV